LRVLVRVFEYVGKQEKVYETVAVIKAHR
jgi:hypothetical protein